jgi:hypothetical protein
LGMLPRCQRFAVVQAEGAVTLRLFATNDFRGHYPVGSAAVVIAENMEEARVALSSELAKGGLKLRADDKVVEIDLTVPSVWIMNNGDY